MPMNLIITINLVVTIDFGIPLQHSILSLIDSLFRIPPIIQFCWCPMIWLIASRTLSFWPHKETARCSIKTGHEICWLLAYRIWMKQLLCEPFHLNPCVHFDPGSSWLVWLVPADGRGGSRTSRWIRCSENFWGWDPVIYLPCSEKDVQWPWSI